MASLRNPNDGSSFFKCCCLAALSLFPCWHWASHHCSITKMCAHACTHPTLPRVIPQSARSATRLPFLSFRFLVLSLHTASKDETWHQITQLASPFPAVLSPALLAPLHHVQQLLLNLTEIGEICTGRADPN